MFSSRFFRRLFFPYLLLICAAIGGVGLFAGFRLRTAYVDSARQALVGEAGVVNLLLQDDLDPAHAAALAKKATELGGALGCRITVIDSDGKVLADNEADAAQLANHLSRPEVIEAAERGEGDSIRYSDTVGADLLYLARRTQGADGKTYFIRLSVHLAKLGRELRLLYATLIGVGLGAMGLSVVICYYFAMRHAAPVRELAGFAEAIARGDMGRQLPSGGAGEIGALTSSLNTMAGSLSSLLSQLTKERGELLAIVASMNEGVIATDTRQRIVLVNEKAAELLDFPRDSAQGKPLWEVVRNEPIIRAAGEVMADGERRIFQVSHIAGRYLEIAACTFPSAGPAEGLVLVAHDTTKSVRYQELRKEFVANVSHELRTPLTVIRGFTETLRDGALYDPVAAPKFLATISKHVDQLQNLVSDLLELSTLESSPEIPRRVSVDLAAVARRVADLLQPAAQNKKQSLNVELPVGVPRILGNPDYLERAVSNLIDNAIKYSPEGGVVNVTMGYSHESVTIEVQDNGIGIPPADLDRIFERFYRVDRSRSREMGGTGLGLSIVKHVAQVHGGSVEVSSTPGAGSRFRLKIPLPVEE
ncbi:MAG TPA: ATP-binding protein [Tepidisphaeraceae bacterium]|nr:ATP-binding protein [Tepidisphaeraceae bacterium]